MNRTLKLAVTTAIAAMGMVSQAHALTNSTSVTSGSLFLYAFEDRQLNTVDATNSAIFDLGLASAFDTASNQTFDFSANSAWTTYISTIANPANIHWGVFGSAFGNGGTNTQMLTTLSVVPASINGTAVNSAITNYNTEISVYNNESTCGASSSCGFNVVMINDLASAKFDDTAGILPSTVTAGLGDSMDFFKYKSNGTKASVLSTQTAFATGGDADYFTLSNTGVLTYTVAAVPEAETYGMMLAGLGLVGFMVRRRKAV
ncbi:MAG TPA: PEP-CTERM sorting domain-containing protein [Thiobacillus sp.]|nr:MAG: hypothetical protein B7Y21_13945 [Hydrogenophilales bacterium 16-61-112]OZA42466.1 MAG: hypothetical protein B7X81_12935 [Hydrogenophilales bacterium 17-61-76]HQT71375.1 PEP-CTERM sorting domain-containing protein [Thiobacillus sp.]